MLKTVTTANTLLNVTRQDIHDQYRVDLKKAASMSKTDLTEYKKHHLFIEHEPKLDKVKFIEMSLSKKEMLLEKVKIVILKLDKMFLAFPYTLSRIEIRIRNIL
jgi:hypothetical protein